MKKMYLSRFAQFFQNDKNEGVVALYHAIKMSVMFIQPDIAENLKKFKAGGLTKDFCSELFIDDASERSRLLSSFVKAGILISNQEKDDEILATVVSDIPRPYPHVLYLMMTDGCNFACKYCFESMNQTKNHKAKSMSFDTIANALDLYAKLIGQNPELFPREKTIIFYGGEPLLNFEGILFAVNRIEAMKRENKFPKKLKLVLITNGTLIDMARAKILKKHRVNVSISLDGNEKHNQNRVFPDGKPAFAQIIAGFKNYQAAGVQTSISCTISEANINEMDSVVAEIINHKIYFLGFNILLGKTTEDYQKKAARFIIEAFNVFKDQGVYEDRMYRKLESFSQRKPMIFDCAAAGGNQLVISPEGTIGVCHGFFQERKYFAESVYDSAANPLTTSVWLEWNKRTPFNMPQCLDCPTLAVCGGGCLMNAEKEYGSIWEVDKRYCEHSLQSLDWLIWNLYESIDK